jgi:hypothetical protein
VAGPVASIALLWRPTPYLRTNRKSIRKPILDTTVDFVLDEHEARAAAGLIAAPANDAALLDAYSQAITGMVDAVGPGARPADDHRRARAIGQDHAQ